MAHPAKKRMVAADATPTRHLGVSTGPGVISVRQSRRPGRTGRRAATKKPVSNHQCDLIAPGSLRRGAARRNQCWEPPCPDLGLALDGSQCMRRRLSRSWFAGGARRGSRKGLPHQDKELVTVRQFALVRIREPLTIADYRQREDR